MFSFHDPIPSKMAWVKNVLEIKTGEAIAALTYLTGAVSEWRAQAQMVEMGLTAPPTIPYDYRVHALRALKNLQDVAMKLESRPLKAAAERASEHCLPVFAAERRYDSHALRRLVSVVEGVVTPFVDLLDERKLFALSSADDARLHEEAHPFGDAVAFAFPSAEKDIAEAAKCLVFDLWTGCVMHCMRALETPLSALARHLGIDPKDDNWNKLLNLIEEKSREVGKKTHGVEAEQWAAEACTHLRFVKNAWRNHAMHQRAFYDKQQAKRIFGATEDFMRHLAGKLTEDGAAHEDPHDREGKL